MDTHVVTSATQTGEDVWKLIRQAECSLPCVVRCVGMQRENEEIIVTMVELAFLHFLVTSQDFPSLHPEQNTA